MVCGAGDEMLLLVPLLGDAQDDEIQSAA